MRKVRTSSILVTYCNYPGKRLSSSSYFYTYNERRIRNTDTGKFSAGKQLLFWVLHLNKNPVNHKNTGFLFLMRIVFIIFCLFIFYSCKTYEVSTRTDYWIDRWNYKHSIWITKTYDRKTDSLIKISVDTVVTDLNPSSEVDLWNRINQP